MAEKAQTRYRRKLREQVTAFMNPNGSPSVVFSTLSEWQQKDWQPYLFGGLLRDLLIFGHKANPRDIDVVVSKPTSKEIEDSLLPIIKCRNRFGGFQVELNRWRFDVWPLDKTWAFGRAALPVTPDSLPKTTFLNVEAIAVSVDASGKIGDLFESGFFEAVESKLLDINFQENPFPALAAVRAISTAAKLNFAMSPRLAMYILDTGQSLGVEALVSAQDKHYGLVRLRAPALKAIIHRIRQSLDSDPTCPVNLFTSRIKQLSLWEQLDVKMRAQG